MNTMRDRKPIMSLETRETKLILSLEIREILSLSTTNKIN